MSCLTHSYTCIHSSSMYATMFIEFIHIPKLTPTIVFINLHCSSTPISTFMFIQISFMYSSTSISSISIHIHTHSSIFSSTFIQIYHPDYIHLSIYVLSFISIQIISTYPSILIKIYFHWCNQQYSSILSYMCSCTCIHIYHLCSSKLHPHIQHCSSTSIIYIHPNVIHVLIYFHPCTQWYPSKIIYIHLSLNPLTSMYPYVFIHIYVGIQHHSFIHITSMCPLFNDIYSSSNPLLSTFIHFPSTFSYTFIHDYLLGCHQQCSSTLFYPHPQFIFFSSTFHPHYPTFMHVHVLLYNTAILPYISWIV